MSTFNAFIKELAQAHRNATSCPPPKKTVRFFDNLLDLLFPEFSESRFTEEAAVKKQIDALKKELRYLLDKNTECMKSQKEGIVEEIFSEIPGIRSELVLDIEAIYMGDPAAKSKEEVVRSYPGFYAIAAHRFAHYLLSLGIKLIPRIISENAHQRTGIDVHPGAKIGKRFCIDHGTGVVIGETTEIGSNVKIYQGVTLGAVSVKKEDAKIKRHPTIEDNVVIYAGATILGGETVIGKNSIVGGNVWLTRSVPEGSKIYYQAKMTDSDGETDTITFK
ncbi:MAG: serine acetyltransferase [Balneolaceae bacterium]|nr:serine acetyltransferase [Balneolaceae bacterium]